MTPRLFILAALVLAVLLSAVNVAYARHSHRQAYIELSRLQKARDAFNIEFRRLQTEQATVSETNRIVGIAAVLTTVLVLVATSGDPETQPTSPMYVGF